MYARKLQLYTAKVNPDLTGQAFTLNFIHCLFMF